VSVPANAERAASADAALFAHMSRTSCDCEDCLADLLCDLMHWIAADPDAEAREQHREEMADLIFTQIPRFHRGMV
jgi:hypothetical protein